jgi:hypothetical protein
MGETGNLKPPTPAELRKAREVLLKVYEGPAQELGPNDLEKISRTRDILADLLGE